MSTSDGVWFLAQLCGLLFAVWGLYFVQGRSPGQTALASLCMALAVGCRPFYALLLACWLVWRAYKQRSVCAILPALLPAAAVAVGMMAYNYVRFGSVTEFGHNYLPEFTRADYGQFSLRPCCQTCCSCCARSRWTPRACCNLRSSTAFCFS